MERFFRPRTLQGFTHKSRTYHGNLYTNVNQQDGKVVEVFAKLGKAGSCESAYLEALTRVTSVALQYGVPLKELAKQMRSVTCHPYLEGGEMGNTSPVDAIGHVLSEYVEKETQT